VVDSDADGFEPSAWECVPGRIEGLNAFHLLLIRSDFSHTLQSLWSVTVLPALPAETLRLIRPLVLKALHFASMNANPAALTARTARRLALPGRAFVFHAPLSAVPLLRNKF